MNFVFEPYTIIFFCGSMAGLFLSCVFFMRRPAPGSGVLSVFALVCALWSLAAGLESGAVAESNKIFFSKIEYVGIVSAGILWLAFALDYTGSKWWRNPRNMIILGLVPLVTLILVWTYPVQHWYWSGTRFVQSSFGPILAYDRGPWYWVFSVYIYTVIGAGVVILARFGFVHPRRLRQQMIGLIIGTLIPLIGNVIYLLGVFPVKELDLTPFSFILAGLVYSITLFGFKFLDVVPVARGVLVESMPDGLVVINADGSIADMNPAAEKMFGVSRISELGSPVERVWPKFNELKAASEMQKNIEIETAISGGKSFLEASITVLKDKRDSQVGQLIILRDVTLRREMEQSLRDSESRYSTLVEQSNEGVFIIQDGSLVFCNRTLYEISGYNPGELINQPLSFLIAPEDRDIVLERYRSRLAGQEVPWTYETHIEQKSLESKEVEFSVGSISFEGKPAFIVSIRDITERKQTRLKLESLYRDEQELRRRLQTEIDRRSKYTRSLVHELRTPLTSILASIELLESEIKDEIYLALVRNIRRAAVNLDQRIAELIELARGEIGMLKISPASLDISQLLSEISSELKPVANSKGLQLTTDIPDLPKVWGDASRLRQVMTNLLSNAIKFTNRGVIQVKAKLDDTRITVSVNDTGRGLDSDETANIFDPYNRKLKAEHQGGGLGIGLALSKMFVELHGGSIWVESTPGKGTTFSFAVPLDSKQGSHKLILDSEKSNLR